KKILTGLFSAYQLEIDRGFTLFGPHRDDLLLKLDNQPAKSYASHGESWSIALALKLSLFKDIQKIGSKPILILDDVFAELDEDRRAHLLNVIAEVEQTFITCAVAGDLPKKLEGNKYFVRSGFVSNYEA
ncbi:MAG: DNA replication and repair protein RecF, partial [Candidatus Fonsibacter sp.]